MNATIIKTPARNLSTTNVSYWLAAYNPNVFMYQRKDFTTFQVSSHSGVASITIAGVMADIVTPIGTLLYYNTPSQNGFTTITGITISGSTTILAVDVNMLPESIVLTGYLVIPGSVLGYAIVSSIVIAGQTITAKHTAGPTGIVRVDLSAYLRGTLIRQDTINYNLLNQIDNNAFVAYSVSVIEQYTDITGNAIVSASTAMGNFWAVNAAMQLGSFGSNMAKYVPFPIEVNINNKAKFLTLNPQPNLYTGYPFDLAFILSAEISVKTLFVSFTTYDINGNPIASGITADQLLAEARENIAINNTGDALLINIGNTSVQLPSQTVGINRLSIASSFVAGVASIQVYLYYLNGSTQVVVSEVKTLKVNCQPTDTVYYMKALNQLGGWDYFLFNYMVPISNSIDYSTVDVSVLDYETQRETQDILTKSVQPKITVGKSGVKSSDIDALMSLLYSSKVYLMTAYNPYTWRGVIVDTKGGDMYDTLLKRGDFEVDVLLPKLNLQSA